MNFRALSKLVENYNNGYDDEPAYVALSNRNVENGYAFDYVSRICNCSGAEAATIISAVREGQSFNAIRELILELRMVLT